jgi:hypothetical protein
MAQRTEARQAIPASKASGDREEEFLLWIAMMKRCICFRLQRENAPPEAMEVATEDQSMLDESPCNTEKVY